MKCKAFDAILRELNEHPQRLERWLADKRLTVLEKKILIGHSYIRNNQNEKVLAELPTLAPSEIDFVDAHRHLLQGIAANNLSRFPEAQAHLSQAIVAFHELDLSYYEFIGRFNLFILYSNQGNIFGMKEELEQLRGLSKDHPLLELRLKRAEFIYADDSGDADGAGRWLQKLEKVSEEMSESDRISHLVSAFMFFIKLEDFSQAQESLEKMKKFRKFQLSENYNFMKKLLAHVCEDKPVYAYASEFQEVPLLFYQLQVIQGLESQDKVLAQQYWVKLQELMPELYQAEFHYLGPKCLFSLALAKHIKAEPAPLSLVENLSGKAEQVLKILGAHPQGIKKDHLFELVWGEEPQSKEELQRLAKLIYKIRQASGFEIESRKGLYVLKVNKSAKAKTA